MKTMQKHVLLFILLSITSSTFAQKRKRFEKIKAHKVAYITDKLELSSKEAEKFWPIYNLYEEKLHQLLVVEKRELIKKVRDNGGIKQLSNSEAEKIIVQIDENRRKIYITENEKFQKLKEVLPSKKLLKLHIAEKSFKKKLIRKLQQKRKKGK